MFDRYREQRRPARGTSRRARATCCTRSSTRASTRPSRCSARWASSSTGSRTTSSRAARRRSSAISRTRSRRSSTSARSSDPSGPCSATSSGPSSATCRRARDLLRRHLRCGRADLGHARELQGSRRGSGVDERVRAVAPPERLVPDPHRGERRAAAADAHRQHLRDERADSRARTSRSRSSWSWPRWRALLAHPRVLFRRRGWL